MGKINTSDEYKDISFDPVEIEHDTNNVRFVGLSLTGFSCAQNIYAHHSERKDGLFKDGLTHMARHICCEMCKLIILHSFAYFVCVFKNVISVVYWLKV